MEDRAAYIWLAVSGGIFIFIAPLCHYFARKIIRTLGIGKDEYKLQVPGIVAEIVENESDNGKLFCAIVAYEVDNQTWKIQDKISCRPALYNLGDKVIVRYKEDHPNKAIIISEKLDKIYSATTFILHTIPTLILILGVSLLAFALKNLGLFS